MKKKEEHINEQSDFFNKIVRQKLENHQLSIDDSYWNEFEQRIKSKSKSKNIKLWIGFSSAAAVILALILVLQPFSEYDLQIENSKVAEIIDKKPNSYIENKVEKENIESTPKITLNKQKSSINKTSTLTKNNSNQDLSGNIITKDEITLENFDRNKSETKDFTQENRISLLDKKYPLTNKEESKKILVSKIQNSKNKWLLGINIGSGGPSQNTYNQCTNTKPGSTTANGGGYGSEEISNRDHNPIYSAENFSEIKYSPSVSFGLMIRKNINNYLGIESGLVYTYLSTKLESVDSSYYCESELNLHYLGIPLNIIISPWKNKKWDFYFSAGIMLEKGISLSYTQDFFYLNGESHTDKNNENINGVQWSLNSSIGAAYKFSKHFGIYFEPRISYYFDNNQPISIRTEETFVIGFNLGVKYEF